MHDCRETKEKITELLLDGSMAVRMKCCDGAEQAAPIAATSLTPLTQLCASRQDLKELSLPRRVIGSVTTRSSGKKFQIGNALTQICKDPSLVQRFFRPFDSRRPRLLLSR